MGQQRDPTDAGKGGSELNPVARVAVYLVSLVDPIPQKVEASVRELFWGHHRPSTDVTDPTEVTEAPDSPPPDDAIDVTDALVQQGLRGGSTPPQRVRRHCG